MSDRVLVIPDIHLRWKVADYIVNNVKSDRIVFLGDFFDQKPAINELEETENTAKWLKNLVEDDRIKPLFSNHDVPYWHPDHSFLWCPGYSREKRAIINKHISLSLWETKWDFVWFEQGWTLSHAGFHRHALPQYPDASDVIDQAYIARACDHAFDNIAQGRNHPILHYGTRMGSIHVGGCTWLDWNDFEPLGSLNQIVGHSPRFVPRCKHLTNDGKIITEDGTNDTIISKNYCIDTALKHYGIIENSMFTIYDLNHKKVIVEPEIGPRKKPNYLDLVMENENIDIL